MCKRMMQNKVLIQKKEKEEALSSHSLYAALLFNLTCNWSAFSLSTRRRCRATSSRQASSAAAATLA